MHKPPRLILQAAQPAAILYHFADMKSTAPDHCGMKAAPAEIFANSPSLYIFGFGIFAKGIMQLFFPQKGNQPAFSVHSSSVLTASCAMRNISSPVLCLFLMTSAIFSPAANAAPSIVPTAANSFAPSNGASAPKVKRTSSGRTVKFRIPSCAARDLYSAISSRFWTARGISPYRSISSS